MDKMIESFHTNGYLVVEEVLKGKQLNSVRQAFEKIYEGCDVPLLGHHERVLFQHKALQDLIVQKEIVDIVLSIIGEDIKLLQYETLRCAPHYGMYGWHSDLNFFCDKVLSCNVGYYLDDMEEVNGPLCVVPGSHKWQFGPPRDIAETELPCQKKLYVKGGSAVIFNTNIWHTACRNNSDVPRRAIFAYYGRYWMKRLDDYYETSLPRELLETTDILKRQLLGLQPPPVPSVFLGYTPGYK